MQWLHKLLRPHGTVVLALSLVSGLGLGWIFANGWEGTAVACCFYPLSACSLGILVLWLVPRLAPLAQKLRKTIREQETDVRFRRSLISGAGINLVYSLFQLGLGYLTGSTWTGNRGAYQLIMGLIHLVLLGYEGAYRRAGNSPRTGWRGFFSCGLCLLSLHLVMAGLTFQMIWQGETETYPSVLIFAVAAYTFYKLTIALIRVIRYWRNANPLWGAAKNIDLSEAIMNLYILQTALLQTFSSPEQRDFCFLMNSLTGTAVSLMTVGGAIGMALHGRKKMQGAAFHGQ